MPDFGLLRPNKPVFMTSQPAQAQDITALFNQMGSLSFRVGWWQAQDLPASRNPIDWLNFILLKLLGLGITAVAVSQGSSFWYDLLKKATGTSSDAQVLPPTT